MKSLLSIALGLCIFSLQACAAQEEPRTIHADLSSSKFTQEKAQKKQDDIVSQTSSPAHQEAHQANDLNAQSQEEEYHPYIIYEDEGIDKEAIHASKHLEFADDPNARIFADLTDSETQKAPTKTQNHLIVSQNTSSQVKHVPSHEHELKNNFVSNKFKNMEECTQVIVQHMLRSPIFANHTPSAIILGKVTNNTGDDSLPIAQIERVLQSTVSKADFIKIVHANLEKSVNKYDYTTNVLVQKSDDKSKHDSYTIRVQLLNFYGELIGQWSAQTS